MRILLRLIPLILIFGCKKDKDTVPTGPPVNQDAYFMMQASLSTYTAIQFGHISGTVSTDPAILAYSDQIGNQHTLYRQALIDVSDSVNLQVSDSLDPAHLTLRNDLLNLSGRAFDSVYIHNQVRDLSALIVLHQSEISSGSNAYVKSFATSHMQEIQEQKSLADSIAANY